MLVRHHDTKSEIMCAALGGLTLNTCGLECPNNILNRHTLQLWAWGPIGVHGPPEPFGDEYQNYKLRDFLLTSFLGDVRLHWCLGEGI